MSFNVDIKKEIEIDFPLQIDHVKCRNCGDDLDFDVNVDGFGDLQIAVEKCDCGD